MDWGSLIELLTTLLVGGGLLTFVTIKDKKTEAILSNMQKVIDEQREMMRHKKEMYEGILSQKNNEIDNLQKTIVLSEQKLASKDDKIEDLYKINSSLRHKLDDANTRSAVADVMRCDIASCPERRPPFGSHMHLGCEECVKIECETKES